MPLWIYQDARLSVHILQSQNSFHDESNVPPQPFHDWLSTMLGSNGRKLTGVELKIPKEGTFNHTVEELIQGYHKLVAMKLPLLSLVYLRVIFMVSFSSFRTWF